MSTRCTGEPISWLRLERHALGELSKAERAEIDRHLAVCTECRACAAVIQDQGARGGSVIPAASIDAAKRARTRRRWRRLQAMLSVSAGLAAAAAVVMLVPAQPIRPIGDRPFPPARVRVKGGELAIALVREHGGDTAANPSRFAPGDRFKVLVSCPPPAEPYVDVVVFQDGNAWFPLGSPRVTPCSNRVPLDGAFELDGDAPATVCVVLGSAPPARGDGGGLPAAVSGHAACTSVEAVRPR